MATREGAAPRTDRRSRSQARSKTKVKRAQVVLSANRTLDEHARVIQYLGRCFEDVVEIGRRLAECREILKGQREWIAWLKAEFSWSRRTADRFIALFENREKVRNMRTLGLPLTALYALAVAPPKVIGQVEQRAAAGQPTTVREALNIVAKTTDPPRSSCSPPTPAAGSHAHKLMVGPEPPWRARAVACHGPRAAGLAGTPAITGVLSATWPRSPDAG